MFGQGFESPQLHLRDFRKKIPFFFNIQQVLLSQNQFVVIKDRKDRRGSSDSFTAADVDALEPLIDSAYRAYTKDSTVYLHDLLPLRRYLRQYVAVVDSSGERKVWVNFFCGAWGDWRHYAVVVDDGGNCFFQLFINLTRRQVLALIPNGYA